MYPEDTAQSENEDDEEEDLEASIAREVAALKKPKSKKRYANITTGTDCGKIFSIINNSQLNKTYL